MDHWYLDRGYTNQLVNETKLNDDITFSYLKLHDKILLP